MAFASVTDHNVVKSFFPSVSMWEAQLETVWKSSPVLFMFPFKIREQWNTSCMHENVVSKREMQSLRIGIIISCLIVSRTWVRTFHLQSDDLGPTTAWPLSSYAHLHQVTYLLKTRFYDVEKWDNNCYLEISYGHKWCNRLSTGRGISYINELILVLICFCEIRGQSVCVFMEQCSLLTMAIIYISFSHAYMDTV